MAADGEDTRRPGRRRACQRQSGARLASRFRAADLPTGAASPRSGVFAGAAGADIPGVLAVPADRRLRFPVRLRGDGPRRAERRDRVDVPATDGLRRACSARSSTGTPAASGSARRASPCRPTAATCRARWSLETSWDCGEGWIIVRDCLLMGPWRHEHPAAARTPGRRPTTTPSTCCCAPSAASTARCSSLMDCEPVFDYGRTAGQLAAHRARLPPGCRSAATDSDLTLTLTTDIRIGFEGPSARSRTLLKEGETQVLRAVVGQPASRPRTYDEAYRRLVWTAHHWQHWLAARRLPRPSLAQLPGAQRADAQGPHVRADRGHRGRGDDVAAGDARRRAQLGLPLQLDPRRHLRAVGPVHARLRVGGQRLLRVPHRRRRAGPRRHADRLRHRRPQRADRSRCSSTCTATRAPGRCGSATPPTRSSRTTSGASCSTPSTCTPGPGTGSTSGSGRWPSTRSSTRSSTGASPTAASGRCAASPQHFTSSKMMCWVAADRGARLARMQRGPGRSRALAGGGRRDPRRHLRERGRRARRVLPALRAPTALDASLLLMPLLRFLPPDDPRIRATVLAIADELTAGRPGAPLPGGGDRRRAVRRRRARSRSARSGWCPRWPRSASIDRARDLCEKLLSLRQPAAALRRGDRPAHRPAPGQLPAGLHAPGADQRGHARHRARRGGGQPGREAPRRNGRGTETASYAAATGSD